MSDSSALPFVAPAVEELIPLFPNYEMLNLVAFGGMGAVYRARQASLDRIVAIKILPPELGADREYAERFQSEARLMANLSNPHIVTVFDFGLTGSYLYFVMEYVDGRSLHEVIREDGPMKPDACARTMAEVCRGLDYAHGKGLVHLDIKPANIMINREGEARVLDFGLAKVADPRKGSATETMGTPDYAAPERTMDGAKVDHRADIYSLGIMLYELLTGKIPRGNFTPASQVSGVSPAFDAIIKRCTQQDPEKRFQKAGEIFVALVKIRRSAAQVNKPVGSGPVVVAAAGGPGASGGSKVPSSAVAAYQQKLATKGSKAILPWVFGVLVMGALVGGLSLSGVFGGGVGKDRGKQREKEVAIEEEERAEPGENGPERPDKGKGGGNGDGNDELDEEEVAGNGSDEPGEPDGGGGETGEKNHRPFPPEGLKEEIALVGEAMGKGDDLEALKLTHLRVFDGHVYYAIPKRVTWKEAREMADGQGAHLVTLNSEEEEKFVRKVFFADGAEDRGSRPLWIGARLGDGTETEKAKWEWVTGEKWGYTGWGEGGTDAGANGETVAVIHENSWRGRAPDDSYAALIEWDPPKKSVIPPVTGSEITGMPTQPAAPLTALESLRTSFEGRMRTDVVEKREKEMGELGENYLNALEGLAVKWETVSERSVQISTERERFQAERDVPEMVDTWPDLARVQGVLTTEARRIDDEARNKRQQLIRTYGDALLKLQAENTAQGKWDEVALAKEERQRIEQLKSEADFAAMVAVPKGIDELEVLVEAGDGDVKGACFVTRMPDGERFLTSGADGKLRVFSAEDGEMVAEWDAGHALGRTAFLKGDDRFLALNPEGGLEIWSLEGQVMISDEEEEEGAAMGISLRSDGAACVVSVTKFLPPKDGGAAGIRPWAISDTLKQGEFDPKINGWTEFSPDGNFLAVSEAKGLSLLAYGVGEAKPVWENTDCKGEAVAYSADGGKVVCGRIVVDAETGETLTDLRETEAARFLDDDDARAAWVQSVALDRDGRHAVFGLAGGGIEVWNIESRDKIVMEEEAHARAITDVELSGDGKRLATSDASGVAKLWEVLR